MILVLGAMDEEIGLLRTRKVRRRLRNSILSPPMGVGKVQAAAAVQEALRRIKSQSHKQRKALRIILIGSAGGISRHLKPRDVVISTEAMFHDIDASPLGFPRGEIPFTKQSIWQADEKLIALAAQGCHAIGITPHYGRMLTGDRFIANDAEAHQLSEIYEGLTVDWETAAIAFIATRHNVPWVSIRIISDTADQNAKQTFTQHLPTIGESLARIVTRIDQLA